MVKQVFIVRPFGKKSSYKKEANGTVSPIEFDFDDVQSKLIDPALRQAGVVGGTTGEIFKAGSIHEDMFTLLLTSDLIIADISIYNANVFYELGIRHTLRKKGAILIKCSGSDETPFDIIGYRYISYAKDNPSASIAELVQAIKETIQSNGNDSPVFNWLPKLEEQDAERFKAMPNDFVEEVKIAFDTQQEGRLALMAEETEGYSWQGPALRLIGESMFNLKAMDSARTVWEQIRSDKPFDKQANDRLATIYQRLAGRELAQNPTEAVSLLSRSNLAIGNLLSLYENLDKQERAEAFALKARNIKTQWINTWRDVDKNEIGAMAVQSGYLQASFENYERGYYENLNHFYSGINALSLLTIMIELAETYPVEWELKYKTRKEADQELEEWKEKKSNLATSVQMSIEAERKRLDMKGNTDMWLEITDADFTFLTETNPARVTAKYKAALQGGKKFHFDAAYGQMEIFERLGILHEKVKAALKSIPASKSVTTLPTRILLFTGHMIDKPDRKEPRFPASKELAVRQRIREIIEEERKNSELNYKGIAGGACGGDILFHEVCGELKIETEIYLALPREKFIVESVQFAGPQWVERFNSLYNKLPHQILAQTKDLSNWLQQKKNYSIWERNNLWELTSALTNGGMHMTLIALWDGKGGDGPGGTEHMVKEATARGAKVVPIDITTIQ
jgi:hypothetical protein